MVASMRTWTALGLVLMSEPGCERFCSTESLRPGLSAGVGITGGNQSVIS